MPMAMFEVRKLYRTPGVIQLRAPRYMQGSQPIDDPRISEQG